ncbi:MAG: Hcp1 family type secretion system effector [Proteobacteria bacterium]|nr:Hcp1 family type secretion system effector [Pseudomonadota bacterium]
MALDMFLVIEGEIEGETKDDVYKAKGGIDVLAFSWGMSQAGSFHMGGGGGAGKASFQDISVTKYIDNSSPVLMLYCANGDHFASAEIIVRKAGKDPLEYYKIKMNKVLITSVSTGGSGGEDKLTENVSLNFESVELAYSKQLADGSGEAPKEFKWDIGANVAL